jgi:hypothetical protein
MTEHVGLDWYKSQADSIATQVFASLKALGELILKAAKDLQHEEFEEFEAYLLTTWTRSDLRAARAVAKGDLDARLFPAGVRNSKVLSLSEQDQQRLLSDEHFQVWGNDGRARSKTWGEMSPDEHNRLLGPKGGRIHSLDEQRRPGSQGVARVAIYEHAAFQNGTLSLNGVKARGEIQAGALKASMAADELAAFVAALQA